MTSQLALWSQASDSINATPVDINALGHNMSTLADPSLFENRNVNVRHPDVSLNKNAFDSNANYPRKSISP